MRDDEPTAPSTSSFPLMRTTRSVGRSRSGDRAPLPFPVRPHKLRHATGYKLANDGQDTRAIQHYLGHKNIVHTTRYTNLAADRFKMFWRDCRARQRDLGRRRLSQVAG